MITTHSTNRYHHCDGLLYAVCHENTRLGVSSYKINGIYLYYENLTFDLKKRIT